MSITIYIKWANFSCSKKVIKANYIDIIRHQFYSHHRQSIGCCRTDRFTQFVLICYAN
jgi:hypothetical protein